MSILELLVLLVVFSFIFWILWIIPNIPAFAKKIITIAFAVVLVVTILQGLGLLGSLHQEIVGIK